MKKLFLVIILAEILISCGHSGNNETQSYNVGVQEYGLMPLPEKIEQSKGKCRIDQSFNISMNVPSDARTPEGVQRFIKRLDEKTALFLRHDLSGDRGTLHIICNRHGELEPGEDESYHLRVSPGVIELSAITDLGILHGLETLIQLLQSDEKGYYFPCMVINDQPRFTWRGLLIDVSRHFLTVETIKRNLDAMAAVKMNVLHLHLTDDQGFRIETKTFPELYKKGSDGQYYTQDQMKDLIAYADARGIRIVPEFDIPGHTTSWFPGHPELAMFPDEYKIEREFGIFDCVMDPTKESTYSFLDQFITEMCALFPDSYFHIGGDENNGVQWDSSRTVQAFKQKKGIKTNHDLQAYFNERINRILIKNNKKMVGWEEIANKNLRGDIVVQSWRGDESLSASVKAGYNVILSKGYYIDLLFPAANHYLVDPIPTDSTLTEEQKNRILGGEATMWSEYVTMENVDSRIWPRTAAIAERFWSPANVRDVEDMYKRLDVISIELEQLGITHIKNREMMMRRIANGENIEPLRVLVDAIEPLHEYERWPNFKEENGYTLNQFSPYTRVMDIAGPDARDARIFNQNLEHYLQKGDKKSIEKLRSQLNIWKENDARLQLLIAKSPALKEISTLSKDLSQISQIGLDALKFIESNRKPGKRWLHNSKQKIKDASEPRGQTTLMITGSIEQLVAAIDEQ